jgi:hypothetical protein
MSEYNYRIRNMRGWVYYPTLESFEKEIELLSCVPLAEFYQPGIGWVRYSPQPVDYVEIIRRLVAAGDGYVEYSMKGIPEAWVEAVEAWENIRNSAEVKKVLGEA